MVQKTVLLVEDDFLNRRLSRKLLMENNYRVLEAKNCKEALEIINKEIITCAILDINLGEDQQDGISLGQQIKETFPMPFIYLTAYDNPEIIGKAIKTLPYSYLTKPFKNSDLIASIEIAIRKFKSLEYQPTILVKDGNYNFKLALDNINYIESEGNYLLFCTDEKIYKIRSTIKKILEELSASQFIQVHRAYIVNKAKIQKFNNKSVVLSGITIPVSDSYVTRLDDLLK